jgi:hypothetical protein
VQRDASELSGTPPIRRNLLAVKPTSEAGTVFYDSALSSLSWLDIDPTRSNVIFSDMISAITSGRLTVTQAVQRAGQELGVLVGN